MTLSSIYYLLRGFESRPFGKFKLQTSSTMNNFNFSDCRKAVNQATFRPTAERKALAMQLLQEAVDFISSLEEVKDKPKASKTKRRRRKTTKRTPSQKVADRQEMANKTNEVGPVKPSKKAKTASVKEAQASLKEMDEKNKAKRQSKIEAKKVAMGVNEVDRVASLEAKIEALTQCLALHMESSTPASADFVSIDDLPFQL
jgi:hypothetical protein